MTIKNSILFIVITLLLLSCDEKRVFDEYKSVGSSWHKDSIINFKLPKLDSLKKYNMYVNTRVNNDYPFDNLFLIVTLQQPNKNILVDTLEYQMANPDGTIMGEGFSDIKESKLFYKQKDFKLQGDYKVKIQQAVRQTGKVTGVDKLNGITEVGFRIESLD